ncbi:hypothetical protein LX81_02410 [Palleronia aestuarii]|uniref:DUF2125 domain-containing protein n=1 Tax=Palleronia aestuarii TaxID=568105 RepID=A0A2W7NC96_9RHOB|nr:DUF2125 domain-containing protein [Palleronia aestuarii]PZX15777.1 hypothetical protein LX81_02410 [Palleronia aestuarii]
MIRIVWIVLAAAIAWSVWWFVGSTALERQLRSGIEEMRAAGWEIALDDLSVRGFPNRFDTTFDTIRATDPDRNVTWEAPFFQILALSYRPNRIIAILPDTQRIEGDFGTVDVATDRARGSVLFRPNTALTLDHSEFVIEELDLAGPEGRYTMEELLFATRLPVGSDDGSVQNVGLTIRNLDLSGGLEETPGPARIDYATLNADISLDAPLDRHAFSEPPRITGMELTTFRIDWGEVRLTAEGSVEIGADGRPEGVIDVELENWEAALDRAAALGLVEQDDVAGIRQAAGLLSGFGGGGETMALPLTFRDGQMTFGPVPLGPAPRLPPS